MRAPKNRSFQRLLKRIGGDSSGNALLLMALGLPMLIGGAGLGVDFAQWYMWKRELQYAVDQAAIAGAWARSDTSTQAIYADRARQEYTANLSAIAGIASTPVIGLANYAGGANNSVTVHADATKALPFSSLFTGGATTIGVHAQAAWEQGKTFTSCLIAVDPDDDGAITIGGSSVLTANCGSPPCRRRPTRSPSTATRPSMPAGFSPPAGSTTGSTPTRPIRCSNTRTG
jgi:Flp pilus assembly protein TadG